MVKSKFLNRQLRVHRDSAVYFVSFLVGAYGIYNIAGTLYVQIFSHRLSHITSLFIDLPILIGISVIYLSTLLRRRKRTAWLVSVIAFVLYLGIGITTFFGRLDDRMSGIYFIRSILLPIIILIFLFTFRKLFIVKSDIQGFRFALRIILILMSVTIIYGVAGFELLDTKDFHQEIGWQTGLHYTVDQFNLTTNKPIHPYTRRARVFVDSLSFISLMALIYAAFSLFQPLRSRFTDQSLAREKLSSLLHDYGAESEEFFKVWPHDKQYYFDESGQSGLAFHVYHGVALCLSDPIGNKQRYKDLLSGFMNLCFNNDWLPAFIHTSDTYIPIYEDKGFSCQKLGQEAVVDIEKFNSELRDSKYFRQILNKFNKQDYKFELLEPPHHQAVIDRLTAISDDWLSKGGRSERGFAMGYYTPEYMQQCQIAIARDAAGTIQAFTNTVPADFDKEEATYDLLRQSNKSLSNVTDYLLMNLMDDLGTKGFKRLNMGLSALAGLDEEDNEKQSILDNVLKFAYSNGDRFYSFSGIYRFKSKYDPEWHDKYVVYKGGIRGFSRTMTALTRCMSKVVKN